MSDNQGNRSSDEDAERKRKGKAIQLSDDEQKETEDNIEDLVAEDLSSAFYNLVEIGKGGSNDDSVQSQQQTQRPGSLDDEDFSIFRMAFEIDGGGNFYDFLRRQKQALQYVEQTNISVQENQISELPDEDSDGEAQIQDCETYSTDSDANKEDTKLIFEVQMTDRNRLVIPEDMMSDYIPRMVQPETLHLIDSLDIMWKMTISFDTDVDNFIITTGLNAYVELHHLNPPDLIRVYLKGNEFRINHQQNNEESLFTLQIPRSNAEKEEGGGGSGKPDDAAEKEEGGGGSGKPDDAGRERGGWWRFWKT